jgi:ABC-2 type transport system permease protein
MKRGRWLVQVFSLEVRKILAYRVDFWTMFLGSLAAQFAIAWFLWSSIFSRTGAERMGEYTFGSMMLYYFLVPLISRAVQGNEMSGIAEEIYQGTLTRYLLYPLSFFGYKLTTHLAQASLFFLQSVLVLSLYSFFFAGPQSPELSLSGVVMALGALGGSLFLYFCMDAMVELLAFWADNVWSLVVILRFATGLLGGGLLPLSLFPEGLRDSLYLLPFAYFVNFPIRCLMGAVAWQEWVRGMGVIGLWAVALFFGYRIVWLRGRYQYTGVGI